MLRVSKKRHLRVVARVLCSAMVNLSPLCSVGRAACQQRFEPMTQRAEYEFPPRILVSGCNSVSLAPQHVWPSQSCLSDETTICWRAQSACLGLCCRTRSPAH
ncbi:hypothetical protein LZ31DRAFT_378899 [Colletotrichum somersetense]|nr:hypothetical protein LZ31DRAFT_378899 [Colletotrichum somersetense]